jgi:hypothetical protein
MARATALSKIPDVAVEPMRQSLCERSLGCVIGRRNRLPHHDRASSYKTVGQAVSLSNDFSHRL